MNKNSILSEKDSEKLLNNSTLEDKFIEKESQISSLVSYSMNTLKSIEEYLNYLKRSPNIQQIYINSIKLYESNQPIKIKYKSLIKYAESIVGLNAKEFKININNYISNSMTIEKKVDKIFNLIEDYATKYDPNVQSLCNKKISSYRKSISRKAEETKNFSNIKQQIPIKCYVTNRAQNQLHMMTSTNYFSNSNKKKIV